MTAAVLIAFIITAAYKDAIIASPTTTHVANIDPMWRLLIGLGCVPGVVALYFRLTIPETPRFTMDVERNIQQATADIKTVVAGEELKNSDDLAVQRVEAPRATFRDFRQHFGKFENAKVLFGTSWSWFALDVSFFFCKHRGGSGNLNQNTHTQIAFYGLGLNSSIILEAIGFGAPTDKTARGLYVNLVKVSTGNLILSAAGLIPGYWVSFLFIDSWGRKPIQLMGFTMLTILFVIMGTYFNPLDQNK